MKWGFLSKKRMNGKEKAEGKSLLERNLDKCDGYLDFGGVCSLDTLRKYQNTNLKIVSQFYPLKVSLQSKMDLQGCFVGSGQEHVGRHVRNRWV